MSGLVKKWEADMKRGLILDGQVFSWPVAVDPMLRVEPISERLHILWVPIMVEGPAPEVGRPGGEVPVEADQAVVWAEGYRRGAIDQEMDFDRADNPYVASNTPPAADRETRES